MENTSKKQHLNLVTLGHVDSGKSTICGHLLYLTKQIPKELIDKYQKRLTETGNPSKKYSWVFDKTKIQRERGVTIHLSVQKFESEKYHFTLIDTPGHRSFLKNAISGISLGDVGILVVSAVQLQFETGFSKNGQTRDHPLIAYIFGINQLIVCVNKMDDKTVNYQSARFQEIKGQLTDQLKKIGFDITKAQFIPISGLHGDNLVERSPHTEWYEGPSFMQALNNLVVPKRPVDKPLRLPIRIINKVKGVGTVIQGRIETGTYQSPNQLQIAPFFQKSESKTIQAHHNTLEKAISGDIIGINIRIPKKDLRRGFVCGDPNNDPPRPAVTFQAMIIVMFHPSKIKKGYTPIVYCHTASVACEIAQIQQKIDRRTGKILQKDCESLKTGDAANVLMRPKSPVCFEVFKDYPKLGRFLMMDMNLIIGVGIIKTVEKMQPTASSVTAR